jgi:hypothetical protein
VIHARWRCPPDHHAPVAHPYGDFRRRQSGGRGRPDAGTDAQSTGITRVVRDQCRCDFFIILFSSIFSLSSPDARLWSAFIGAGVADCLVWLIGNMGQGSLSPLRINIYTGYRQIATYTQVS